MSATVETREERVRIALAGNPNSGKTSVFNAMTGARQHVGNYPGVTVEHKEGLRKIDGVELTIVDLPGTYSLTAHSEDELVARDFIVEEKPDAVIAVVDASNLERNLYLATQLLELEVPLVLDFNMSDLAESLGYRFDYERLSALLAAPIVPTVGNRCQGIDRLLRAAVEVARGPQGCQEHIVKYGREVEAEIEKLEALLDGESALEGYPTRWLAVKLLESDEEVCRKVSESGAGSNAILAQADKSIRHLEGVYDDAPAVIMAEARYGFISGACQEAVQSTVQSRHDASDLIDKVVTSRLLGIPVFLALMWAVFQLTFKLGESPMGWIESGFEWLGGAVASVLPEGLLQSLIVDGIIGGVGGVLVFLPNILLLFLAIAFLEDSGYMARAAFIMDRLMHKIGLHGKSFIPLLLGFGCTIPAVMATRTLENRRDRLVTILVAPLMSCGARLPVYILLTGAFFGAQAGNVIFSLYMLGIILAIVMAKVFRKFLLPGPSTPFVMELPPYRVPTLKGILIHMWERAGLYLKKAGTIILAISVVIWALSAFPRRLELRADYETRMGAAATEEAAAGLEEEFSAVQLERSYAGKIGHAIAPALKPIGLGDWRIGTALFAGLGAKEVVVSTMGTLYSLGETDEESEALRGALKQDYNKLQAYALMVFVLLYIPCVAAVAVIKRETNSWGWAGFSVLYTTALAWVVSLVVYQGGMLLGLG
jgi:ferrous iron transport protein B